MAGIYIHIPFCKQACHYCNFHFSTSLKYKREMLESLLRELDLRKDYLSSKKIDSVYFGGGTPSLLEAAEIEQILNKVTSIYTLADDAEITLEANPDDLTDKKILELSKTRVNRLSIGVCFLRFNYFFITLVRIPNTLLMKVALVRTFTTGFMAVLLRLELDEEAFSFDSAFFSASSS